MKDFTHSSLFGVYWTKLQGGSTVLVPAGPVFLPDAAMFPPTMRSPEDTATVVIRELVDTRTLGRRSVVT